MSTLQTPNQLPLENENSSSSIGNASNPIPNPNDTDRMHGEQLLGKGAEKYLREVASIEDLPDPQDQQDMDETIEAEKDQQ